MTERKPLMAGNWKMNINHFEAIALVQKLAFRDREHVRHVGARQIDEHALAGREELSHFREADWTRPQCARERAAEGCQVVESGSEKNL